MTTREFSILIVGIGGLGVPAACTLARDGARRLTLVDPDPIDLSNLARQVIFTTDDLGTPKVVAAARWISAKFPDCAVETHTTSLDSSNAARLIARHDFIIDATDSPVAKFLINDVCLDSRTPFVYGGVIGMTGQAMSVIPGATACLRCVFENAPDETEIASCREAGILGPVAGAIGAMQAAEAMRASRAEELALTGKILTYDAAANARVRLTPISPRRGCICGASKSQPSRTSSTSRTLPVARP
ncbi:ThiF family adenylyltransferase [Candidatus Binatus sp.]|uniref:HesA/MoeB/ThiF family protein n=1 Tax=Candidatus Binatus sp. TaxID=2811406 RepID=UPI00351D324A